MRESLPRREAGNRFLLEFVLAQTVRPRTANARPRESARPFFALVAPIILSSVESLSARFLAAAANKHGAKLVERTARNARKEEQSFGEGGRLSPCVGRRFCWPFAQQVEPIVSAVRYARSCARFAFSSRIEARRNARRQNRVEARRTAQGRASVTERGVGDGGQILTTLVALGVAAIRCRLKQITEGIALQPLSFYHSLIPIISSPTTAKKIFDITDVEVLLTGIYTPHVE